MRSSTHEFFWKLLNSLTQTSTSYQVLMDKLGVKRGKIAKAVHTLEQKGFIGTEWGNGPFLLKRPDRAEFNKEFGLKTRPNTNNSRMVECTICNESKQVEIKKVGNLEHYFIPNTMIQWADKVPIGDKSFLKGNVCPDCVDLQEILDDPNVEYSDRKCKTCKALLTKDRYYECYLCKPELPLVDDDFIFEHTDDSDIDELFFEALNDGIDADIMEARRKVNGYGQNNNHLFASKKTRPEGSSSH